MEKYLICIVLVLCLCQGARAQCDEVQLSGCMIDSACGLYYLWVDGDPCSGTVIYKHIESVRRLFVVDGWWLIHDENCSPLGIDASELRVEDGAQYAEDITGVWAEKNNQIWVANANVNVKCASGYIPPGDGRGTAKPSEEGVISIAAIVVICALVIVVVTSIILYVFLCLRYKKKQEQKKMLPKTGLGLLTYMKPEGQASPTDGAINLDYEYLTPNHTANMSSHDAIETVHNNINNQLFHNHISSI